MYYIVKHGEVLNTIADICTPNLASAKRTADEMHEKTGDHYRVIETNSVWTTTTLDELLNERGNRALEEFNKKNPLPSPARKQPAQ